MATMSFQKGHGLNGVFAFRTGVNAFTLSQNGCVYPIKPVTHQCLMMHSMVL